MEEHDDSRADIELDLKRAFEDEAKARRELVERITAAEKTREAGGEIDPVSLAHDYLALALEAQEDDDFETTGKWLGKTIKLLESVPFPSDDMIMILAQAHLTYGVTLNDQGVWSDALAEYDAAEALLEKLSEVGNLDAQLDLAGIRLNIATIRFEQGKYSDAIAAFERVKSEFASLFGTSKEDEAYYYLAKTYMQEAAIYREMGEDEKSLQRLEEVIALYRKMIERGDAEQSVDLAEALAVYAQTLECSGRKTPEEILSYVEEAVARLRDGVAAGRADVCPELLNVSVMDGRLLNYLDRWSEAEELLTETAEIFDGIRDTDDPEALLALMMLFDERGKSRYAQQRYDEALSDFNTAAETASGLSADFFAEDADEKEHDHHDGCDCGCGHVNVLRAEGLLKLFSVYVNRAKTLNILGRAGEAKNDCAQAGAILPRVKEYLEDDYQGYLDIYEALAKSLDR